MNDDQTEEEKGAFALHDAVAELRTKKEQDTEPQSRTPRSDAAWERYIQTGVEETLLDALKEMEQQLDELKEQLDWQNMPNRREPLRGGYEFYINEEWTAVRHAALGEETGCVATLMKVRYDPDDERVRVRRVLDDDAILEELASLKKEKLEAERKNNARETS